MSKEFISDEKSRAKRPKPVDKAPDKQAAPGLDKAGLLGLQKSVGNQAVQRMIVQRSGDESFELDDPTTQRINQARGGGQSLGEQTQQQMGQSMGYDFSNVQVHTSAEADNLNQDLGARAFTTGNDVFFKQGEYDPGSSGGQELLAHELTHVVQQNSGAVSGGGSSMTVTDPNDSYEQEADAVAQQVVQQDTPDVQTQADGAVQREELAEEDMLQGKFIQREDFEEEEEAVQTKLIQRQDELEEEEL